MTRVSYIVALLFVAGGLGCSSQSTQAKSKATSEAKPESGMRPVEDFDMIEDEKARSRGLFGEIGKVLQHPRCMNCHPTGNRPLQGDERLPHQPLVQRGEDGFGAPGMRCTTCHAEQNYRNVPGSPHWHLAPESMGWTGLSTREICLQIKDPERNGGKTLDEIVEHMAKDPLVAYGWHPPEQYEPVPGSQEMLGELTRAWVDTGAHCPKGKSTD
jgi:hypothetical protein